MTRAPDLIVLGRLATFAGDAGYGWVEGLAVQGGRVVAAGTRTAIAALRGSGTQTLELGKGQIALPGLTDAHLHLAAAALAADDLDLEGAPSLEAALAIVADAHEERLAAGDRGGWLLGHGWTIDRWRDRPTAAALERVAPGRPVALWAHDHHTRWLSEAACRLLGIDAATPDPAGGHIGRSVDGRPDGLLYEHASEIGGKRIRRPGADAIGAAVRRYAAHLATLGLTGVHDPGGPDPSPSLDGAFIAVRDLAAAGDLPLRVHSGVFDLQLDAAIAAGLHSGQEIELGPSADDAVRRAAARYRFGWLKLFADGTVGSRTAALLEPYEDAAEHPGPAGPLGDLLESRERLRDQIARAAEAGIATMVHAIGDRAVRTVLDAFASVDPASLDALPLRPRIEHAQLVHPDDVVRFGHLGVVASLQPVQLRSDEVTMRRAWAGRTERSFPVASLAGAGAVVAFGTDAPVEPPDPWPGIAMAVARRAPELGSGALRSGPAEAVALGAALRAATVGPWLAAGDPIGGRLVAGAPADLVVLPLDPTAAPSTDVEALRTLRPLLTLVDGEERHRAPGFDR